MHHSQAHPNIEEFNPPALAAASSSRDVFEHSIHQAAATAPHSGPQYMVYPPPPQLRRAVRPRPPAHRHHLHPPGSFGPSPPVPYHHRTNLDAFDLDAYGLDSLPMPRMAGPSGPVPGPSMSHGFLPGCPVSSSSLAGTEGAPYSRPIQDHMPRSVSVRNVSTSTPPIPSLLGAGPGMSTVTEESSVTGVVSNGGVISRKRFAGELGTAIPATDNKTAKYEKVSCITRASSSGATPFATAAAGDSLAPDLQPPPLVNSKKMRAGIKQENKDISQSNGDKHIEDHNGSLSEQLVEVPSLGRTENVETDIRKLMTSTGVKREGGGAATTMVTSPVSLASSSVTSSGSSTIRSLEALPDLEFVTSTLAPSSGKSCRGNIARNVMKSSPPSSTSVSQTTSPGPHTAAYSQEALRELVCATLAPAAAATLVKSDKRDKVVSKPSATQLAIDNEEFEPQPGPSGLQRAAGCSSAVEGGASSLSAPDLQLDCLSSDTEESSSEDVQVVKIPRRKGKKFKFPVEVDLTQDMTSDDDDITVEEVKPPTVALSTGAAVREYQDNENEIADVDDLSEDGESSIVANPTVQEANGASRPGHLTSEDYELSAATARMYSGRGLPHMDPSIPTSVIMEAEPTHVGNNGALAPDFRPRRLRHPWAAYDLNRCYHHESFQSSPGCTCAAGRLHHQHQGELPDGSGLYQTPPPAHRSSMYPGSLPDNSAARQNRLLRAVQRMNPAHQRIWHLQQNQQERLRRHMGSTRSAVAAPTVATASTVTASAVLGEERDPLAEGEDTAPADRTVPVHYQHRLLVQNDAATAEAASPHHSRDGMMSCNRPMLTVPRIVMGGGRGPAGPSSHQSGTGGGVNLGGGGVGLPACPHPSSLPAPAPAQPPPPPAHLHSHPQQRIFEDPSGRYRRYQHYLHRWHIPVMAEPPNVPFHHGFEDLQHPHPVQHYHNPWNPSSNIRYRYGTYVILLVYCILPSRIIYFSMFIFIHFNAPIRYVTDFCL